MTRKEFKSLLKDKLPSAHCSTQDALGGKIDACYIDVSLPTEDVAALNAIFEANHVRNCGGVGVVPYSGSFRRIKLA